MRVRRPSVAASLLSLLVLASPPAARVASAQAGDGEAAPRAPRFLLATPTTRVPLDASRVAVLSRRIALDLNGVTVGEALDEIRRRSGLRLSYADDVLRPRGRVHLRAAEIPVAGALTTVLLGTGVDVVFTRDGHATLVRRTEAEVGMQTGTIVGRVADAKSGDGLVGAEVLLDGTRWRTTTIQGGRYRLAEVMPGNYTLMVRRVGYAKQSQAIAVAEQEVAVDVALQPVATQLDEIVTTVTGEQRLRELGHVVGRINADSVVKEAPVASLSELLNGRVPGLQVFTNSGLVGGNVSLQVRTPNSIVLGTEPIVFVDGIRYTSSASGSRGPFNVEPTSRLNDLNPNDIESIEVVKGPSAATLYGTDAANGVLVITTKRGRPGATRWNAYGRSSLSETPSQHYPEAWWGWNTRFPTASCALTFVAQRLCTQDSVAALPNPLNDPGLTIFGRKPRWEYGANVSGGRQDLRYYFSGDFEDATGPIQLPPAVVEQLKQRRGVTELPEELLEPNAFTKGSLRANVTAPVGRTAELHLQTGYIHNATRTLSLTFGTPYQSAAFSAPTNPYGTASRNPADEFAQTSTEQVDRFSGSATGDWRPWPWLQARGTLGLDLANSTRYSLARPGETSAFASGTAWDDRTRQLGVTADLGVTATFRRGRLSARTTVGAQYARSLANALSSRGTGLPPGGESVGQAATRSVTQSYSETVTLGSYVEETLGLNDRLFVTGALRMDGASAFGRDYDVAAYPKASVSWIVSDEPFLPRLPGLEELRLRYAFGASGQQARSDMSGPSFVVEQTIVDGATANRIDLASSGNPNLRPERVREHEVGLDASGLRGRVRLGLTWFRRTTTDQIHFRELPSGFGSIYTNIGRVTGRGFEAELTARLVETRVLSWQLVLHHALRRSLVEDLEGVRPGRFADGSYVEGYPLGARFAPSLSGYADVNGNGIIERTEVQLSGEPVYLGESTAPRTQALTTTVGLFEGRLRLSALFERRSGFTQINQWRRTQCSARRCQAAVDPNTPLAAQAEAVAITLGVAPVEPGDFTRFREMTATLELPPGLVRTARLHSATFSVAARNLALWKSFAGADPESAWVSGIYGGLADGIPQSRSWVLRLDLGL